MNEEQMKKAADFLGVKVLNPLEEKSVLGGLMPGHHHETHHESHHDEVWIVVIYA